jgi:hypothetical protein
MCLFVAAIVPQKAMTPEFAAVASRHGMPLSPLSNATLGQQLAPTEQVWITTRSHCDCGSELFSRPKRTPRNLERERQKLKKKGWGEAKIEKWIQATERSRLTSPTERVVTRREWLGFLSEALALRTTPYVAILGHSYGGDLSIEELRLEGRTRRLVEELDGPAFEALTEDTVHEFRPSTAHRHG